MTEEEQPYINRSIRREFEREANKNRRKSEKKKNKKATSNSSSSTISVSVSSNKKPAPQQKNKKTTKKNKKKDTSTSSSTHATTTRLFNDRNLLSRRTERSIKRMSQVKYTTVIGNLIDDAIVGVLEDGNIIKGAGKIVYDGIFIHMYKILDQNKNDFNNNRALCQKIIQPIAKYVSNKCATLVYDILDNVETAKKMDKDIFNKGIEENEKEGEKNDRENLYKQVVDVIAKVLMKSFGESIMIDTLMNGMGESLAKLMKKDSAKLVETDVDRMDKTVMSVAKDGATHMICEVVSSVYKAIGQRLGESIINKEKISDNSGFFMDFLQNLSQSNSPDNVEKDQNTEEDVAKGIENVKL